MDLRRRGKRPAVLSILRNNFHDLVRQLFLNAPVCLGGQLRPLGNGRRPAMRARAFRHWETSGHVANLIDESSVRVGDVKSLH